MKIDAPSQEVVDSFKDLMAYESFEVGRVHGAVRTGKQFEGTHTVAAVANAYGLELICRVLRAACVPYSLHTGKTVRKRGKTCTTSTQFTLTMVEITAEVQPTSTED